jgi:hypothetical protein
MTLPDTKIIEFFYLVDDFCIQFTFIDSTSIMQG